MEVEVFGGLEEILKGKEKQIFDSFLNVHEVDVLENIIVSDQTSYNNNNVVSPNLEEQATNDLDEDLDEVMEIFKKKTQESDEQIYEDDEALTVEALLELEQSVVLDGHGDHDDYKEQEKQGVKEVHHESFPGNKHVGVHFERCGPMHHSGLLSLGGNYSRYQNYSQYNFSNSRNMNYGVSGGVTGNCSPWNARNMNYGVSGQVTNQHNTWDSYYTSTYLNTPGGVLGRSSILPSLSSSSSSFDGDYNRPKFLLGGLVDISFLKSSTPPSSNGILHGDRYSSSPSWNNNLHGATLGNSYSSYSSSSPYAPWNDLSRGESFYGTGGCGGGGSSGYLSQWGQEGTGVVGLSHHSRPKSCLERSMSTYERYCNILNKVSNGSHKVAPKKTRKKREVKVELPPGWEVVRRPRKNGKSKGQIDTYYINRETKQRFRSLPELYRYLDSQANNNKSEV